MIEERLRLANIAQALNLSVTTVSRVLHNRPDVKPETRRRVLELVQSGRVQVSPGSSDLNLVGVVDNFRRHALSSYYNAQLLDGIDRKLHASGYVLAVIHADVIDLEHGAYDNVRAFSDLAGLIWLEPVFDRRYRQIVVKHNIPCVVVNSYDPEIAVDAVECDSYAASVTATEYLLGLGHRAIAFLGGQLSYANIRDRLRGYHTALERAGITPDPRFEITDIATWDDQGGAGGVYRLFSRSDAPTALLVSSDFLIGGVYRAIRELGRTIPAEVSVISFDDSPLAPYLDPPVTSCRQPLQEIGELAAERLLRIIATPQAEREPLRRSVAMPFIVRGSTAKTAKKEPVQS